MGRGSPGRIRRSHSQQHLDNCAEKTRSETHRFKMDVQGATGHIRQGVSIQGSTMRSRIQTKTLDYTETFSPVRYDFLRILLVMMAEKDLELVQFDVRTAFLYGELQEEIYMEIPEGLVVEKEEKQDVVCKLNKILYGLKQAPRWNEKFRDFLKQFNFRVRKLTSACFAAVLKEPIFS